MIPKMIAASRRRISEEIAVRFLGLGAWRQILLRGWSPSCLEGWGSERLIPKMIAAAWPWMEV